MKNKKLVTLLLAAIMSVSGAAVVLTTTACDGGKPDSGTTQVKKFTVKFLDEKGNVIATKEVESGVLIEAAEAVKKAGYSITWVDANNTVVDLTKGVTADTEFKLKYVANTDTAYKVEHYFEDLDGQYVIDAGKTENLKGTTDSTVNATAKTVAHFNQTENTGALTSAAIKGDGSLVLKVYYARERLSVIFKADDDVLETKSVPYGKAVTATTEAVPAKDKTESTETSFTHWALEGTTTPYNFTTEVTGNITLVAQYQSSVRHYRLDATLFNNLYYLASDAEGNAWGDAVDEGDFNPEAIEYNTDFTFKVEPIGSETDGTPVVSVTTYDDDGEVIETKTLTPAADGFFTIKMNRDTKLEITGLVAKQHTVKFDAQVASYDVAWASLCTKEEVQIELINAVTKQKTYHKNVLTETGAQLVLTKGTYTATFVKEDGNGGYVALTSPIDFYAASEMVEGGSITVPGSYMLGVPAVTSESFSSNKFVLNNGVIECAPELNQDKDNQFHADFADFAPGKADFAATITYQLDQSKVTEESDPTFGLRLHFGAKMIQPMLNRGGMRLRNIFAAQVDKGGLLTSGNMLGKNATGFDKVTEVLVKKGEKVYIFITGERVGSASVEKVENKLLAYLDREGVHFSDGTTMEDTEGNIAAMFESDITAVNFGAEQTNNCWIKMFGYGYTLDQAIVDQYANSTISAATVTGDVTDEVTLESNKTTTLSYEIPAGKIVKALTVNGEESEFRVEDGMLNIDLAVPFDGKKFNIEVKYEDGVYGATITGTVTAKGSPMAAVKVSDGKLYAYTNANGEFTLKTAVATSYNLTAYADGYVPTKLSVTDITSPVEIKLANFSVGGTATVGSKTYATGDMLTGNAFGDLQNDTFVHGVDDNGNEYADCVSGTTKIRQYLMFNDFAAEQFVVKASIKYSKVTDGWPRIGFAVTDENGTAGQICAYGNQVSSTFLGWGVWGAAETIPADYKGLQGVFDAGKIEIAMMYDKGNVKLYQRCVNAFKTDKWYLMYSGPIVTGTSTLTNGVVASPNLPTGKVAVALMETSLDGVGFRYSDLAIKEGLGSVEFVESDEATFENKDGVITVTPAAGRAISDVKMNGVSILSQGAMEGMNFKYTLPALWQLGECSISAETKERSQSATLTGIVSDGTNPIEGAKIEYVNLDGVKYTAVSGADGSYTIEDTAATQIGEMTVTVSMDGYLPKTGKVACIYGENTQDIVISKALFISTNANTVVRYEGLSTDLGAKQDATDVDYKIAAGAVNNQNLKTEAFLGKGQYFTYTLTYNDADETFAKHGTKVSGSEQDADMYYQIAFDGHAYRLSSTGCMIGSWDETLYPSATASGVNPFDFAMDRDNYANMPTYTAKYDFAYVKDDAKVYLYGKYNGTSKWILMATADSTSEKAGFDQYQMSARNGYTFNFSFKDMKVGNDITDITGNVWDNYKDSFVENAYASAGKNVLADGSNEYTMHIGTSRVDHALARMIPAEKYDAKTKTAVSTGNYKMFGSNADWSVIGWTFQSSATKRISIELRVGGTANNFFIAMGQLGDAYGNRYTSINAVNEEAGLLVCDPAAFGTVKNAMRELSVKWVVNGYRYQCYIGEFGKEATQLVLDIDMQKYTSNVSVALDGASAEVREAQRWGGTADNAADKVMPDPANLQMGIVMRNDTVGNELSKGIMYVENYKVRYAQKVAGVVKDANGALEGANVSVKTADGTEYTAVTDAEGKYAFDVLTSGDLTLTVSKENMLSKVVKGALSETMEDIVLSYGVGTIPVDINGWSATSDEVKVSYDGEAKDVLGSMVVNAPKGNQVIAYAQPLAANSAWGFTMEFPEGTSFKPDGTYYDEDVYFQWRIGHEGANMSAGLTSAGAALGDINDHGDNAVNPFGGVCENGTTGGLKVQWSAKLFNDIDIMFVRNGSTVSQYGKYHGDSEYVLMGTKTGVLTEDGAEYFTMYNSWRTGKATVNFNFKNWFYNVGNEVVVSTETAENVTLIKDKETYAHNEVVTFTATAADGYDVVAIIVNGQRYNVTAGKTATLTAKALAGKPVTAKAVVAAAADKVLTGAVTVTFENADAKYVGSINNGAYSITAAPGTYKATFTTGAYKLVKDVTVTDTAEEAVALDTRDTGFYKVVVNQGLAVVDDEVYAIAHWAPQELAFNTTFVPDSQVLEFGYTLYGNMSAAHYPFLGMFVKDADEDKILRTITTFGAGDQVGFIAWNDYNSRLTANDEPWLLWKGGFIPGQDKRDNGANGGLSAVGIYWDQANANISFKWRVDGHKISLWIKGSNKWRAWGQDQFWSSEDWVKCFTDLNAYDRYNSDGDATGAARRDFLDQLYKTNEPCYFGISNRTDNYGDDCLAKYKDLWFNITDRVD